MHSKQNKERGPLHSPVPAGSRCNPTLIGSNREARWHHRLSRSILCTLHRACRNLAASVCGCFAASPSRHPLWCKHRDGACSPQGFPGCWPARPPMHLEIEFGDDADFARNISDATMSILPQLKKVRSAILRTRRSGDSPAAVTEVAASNVAVPCCTCGTALPDTKLVMTLQFVPRLF